jgi:hypothetical protein
MSKANIKTLRWAKFSVFHIVQVVVKGLNAALQALEI